jgi:hypothetical protein
MGPLPLGEMLNGMLSPNTRSAMANRDVVQLLEVEHRLRAQAEQLMEAADQLASLRERASMSWSRA